MLPFALLAPDCNIALQHVLFLMQLFSKVESEVIWFLYWNFRNSNQKRKIAQSWNGLDVFSPLILAYIFFTWRLIWMFGDLMVQCKLECLLHYVWLSVVPHSHLESPFFCGFKTVPYYYFCRTLCEFSWKMWSGKTLKIVLTIWVLFVTHIGLKFWLLFLLGQLTVFRLSIFKAVG